MSLFTLVISEQDVYELFMKIAITFAPLGFGATTLLGGWYGRLAPSWLHNIALPGRIGWFIAEIISPLALLYGAAGHFHLYAALHPIFYMITPSASDSGNYHSDNYSHWLPMLLIYLWLLHYLNRAIILPLKSPHMSPIPIYTALAMMSFNVTNGWLNGYWIGKFGPEMARQLIRADNVLGWLKCILGLNLFIMGWSLNIYSDYQLLALKRSKYSIPYGGMFELISCPHYFGEIVEWTGWALMAGSWPGYLFVVNTAANLIPRSLIVHAWYQKTFSNYPPERRAIIPFLL
ncbi:3-oxo-5-alpha-steroid 4-dehydrogenase-domain-containing protein [Syncephalis fuscata]|nr:3-oxo-5-alpha-steroid 4-dehydrogenase-domain-containing protein [Syncephalis fuscata]